MFVVGKKIWKSVQLVALLYVGNTESKAFAMSATLNPIAGTAVPSETVFRKDLENKFYNAWKVAPTEEARWAWAWRLRGALLGHAQAVMFGILRRADSNLVTDAVNKVMLNLESFDGNSQFTTWAHKIIMSVMYDQRRADRRRREVSLNTPGFDLPTESSIGVTELMMTVKKLLDPEEFAIFEQLVSLGKTRREASEALDIPKATLDDKWELISRKLQDVLIK
jgi:DNA-directed RNA polymerase specialized sigma24 family protein